MGRCFGDRSREEIVHCVSGQTPIFLASLFLLGKPMPVVLLKILAIETQVKRIKSREGLKVQILFSSEWLRKKSSEKLGTYFFFLAKILKTKDKLYYCCRKSENVSNSHIKIKLFLLLGNI